MRARNNLIDAVGSIDLDVRGTLRDPVMLGAITVDEGRLFLEQNEYEITRGVVLFNNPRRTQPTWNVEAQTEVRDYSVTARIQGSFDQLRLSLGSDPPLPLPVDHFPPGRGTDAGRDPGNLRATATCNSDTWQLSERALF